MPPTNETTQHPRPSARWPSIEIHLTDENQMPWWTRLSIGGIIAALVLAAIGGLPFDLPDPSKSFELVDPTCGLTRGSTALVRGDVALAWRYNPVSFLVVAYGVLGVARVLVGLATGRWVRVTGRLNVMGPWLLIVAILVLWANQLSNAEFLLNSRA